jgi:DNA-binding SARP family transcriptional activator
MVNKMFESSNLRIQMLGLFRAWRQQDLLTWPTQKSKALFQILLIEPGRIVPTDQILEYLWPELPPRKAQNNLWVTVSQLRRVLQPDLPPRVHSIYIHKQNEGYCFNSESDYWLDGDAFAKHLAVAQSTNELRLRIKSWEEARILYKGEFLEDEPYAEWAQIPRTQWQLRYEQLLINLAQANAQNGRYQQAMTLCREILTLDNTNENVYRILMHCLTALGERTTALQVYNEAVQELQVEIGVDPMPETTELARQIQELEGEWKLEIVDSPVLPPFVGRGQEMTEITHLLSQVASNQGHVTLIIGEPGIGKSRLIQEMTSLAIRGGFQLFGANCYQVEQSMSYQPLIDLACQVINFDDHWQGLAPVWLRELAILVPEMSEMAVSATGSVAPSDDLDDSHQLRLFQAIYHLFADQAARHKLLLVVEDIQWADPGTLLCLHYLTRHIVRDRIALFLSLRRENLSTDVELDTLLHSFRREAHFTNLSLGRLSEADTTTMLAQMTSTSRHANRFGHWLYQETDGNPFFVISLLQSLQDAGILDDAAEIDWKALARSDPALALPDAIRDSVLSRLQRLPQIELEVLDWLAAFGRSLDFSTLQAISHMSEMILLNAIEQLAARHLLVEQKGQYDFDHNKIREVVYNDISAARRGLYHRQIAESLEATPLSFDRSAILAHHFERGAENEKALKYWMQAGNHALNTYAYQQATHHFERALALAENPSAQMDAFLGLGRALTLLDDHKNAAGAIRRGLHLSDIHSDDARRAKLMYVLAQNACRQHRSDGGKPEVQAALAAAEQAGDQYYLTQSLLLLTEVQESRGDLSSALETASRAQIVSSKLNDIQLEARILLELGFLRAQRADFDEAVEAVEHGLRLLVKTDDRNAIAYAWNILGRALGGRGDYAAALDAFHHSQEEAQIIGDRLLLAQVFNMLGWLHRELGDYENGMKYDREGVDLARRWGKPSPEISARLNVCLNVLHLGDPQHALDLLDDLELQIEGGSFGFHNWRWRLRLLHARGLCFMALNEPEKALASGEEGLPLAEKNVTRKYVALNHELKGLALAEMGHIEESISELEIAISLADEIHYQPIRWQSRFHLANLYHQIRREQEAKSTSSEAQHIIQNIVASLEDENLRTAFLNAALP